MSKARWRGTSDEKVPQVDDQAVVIVAAEITVALDQPRRGLTKLAAMPLSFKLLHVAGPGEPRSQGWQHTVQRRWPRRVAPQ